MIPDIGMRDKSHQYVIPVFCTDNEDDSIGSRAVNRYACSINAFGLKCSLSQIMMFYFVKVTKSLKYLIHLMNYCAFAALH